MYPAGLKNENGSREKSSKTFKFWNHYQWTVTWNKLYGNFFTENLLLSQEQSECIINDICGLNVQSLYMRTLSDWTVETASVIAAYFFSFSLPFFFFFLLLFFLFFFFCYENIHLGRNLLQAELSARIWREDFIENFRGIELFFSLSLDKPAAPALLH